MDSMLSQDFRQSIIPQVADNKKTPFAKTKKNCRNQVASRMRNHPPSASASEKISHSQLKKSTALAKHKEPSEKSHRRGKIHHRGKKEKPPSRIKKIHREEKSAASAKTPEAVGARHRPEESSGQKDPVAVGDLPPLSQKICRCQRKSVAVVKNPLVR